MRTGQVTGITMSIDFLQMLRLVMNTLCHRFIIQNPIYNNPAPHKNRLAL